MCRVTSVRVVVTDMMETVLSLKIVFEEESVVFCYCLSLNLHGISFNRFANRILDLREF